MAKILIIDDEKSVRTTLREILEYESHKIDEAKDGEEGLKLISKNNYNLVICDIKMPKMNGMELLEKSNEIGRACEFIMISAHGTIDTAIEATKKGAFDFIQKPPDLNKLLITVKNALEKNSLEKEAALLKKKISKKLEMVGNSKSILNIKSIIEKVAPTDARVLITGSSGTGKELVAQLLHYKSKRTSGTLIEVNCAAIPSDLIESELFGHEKGAFTSALKQRIGKFEQATGGTIFLDEIGDMSLSAQAKVLRVLQENKITRVGGEEDIEVDVRVIAATNKNLVNEIKQGNFREDLYHRLNVIIITMPALKDRREDIPLLVNTFLENIAEEYGMPKKTITEEGINYLQHLEWTGNIREIRNVIERLIIMCGKIITLEDVKKYT
jgi:DNA-binding NtrC family response regulator